jgi:hypothetical protein
VIRSRRRGGDPSLHGQTHPLLSPNDEFANYNIWAFLLGDPQGRIIAHIIGSYARQVLKDGIALQDSKGFNPYKFGFGAASDSHSTAVLYRQDNYFGTLGAADGTIERRLSGVLRRHGRQNHRPTRDPSGLKAAGERAAGVAYPAGLTATSPGAF